MHRIRLAVGACALLAASWANAQGVHKCQTPEGKTIYSDSPCAGTQPGNPSAPPPTAQPSPVQPSTVQKPAARKRYEPPPPGSLRAGLELNMKENCDKGLKEACEVLQAIRSGRIDHGEAFTELGKKLCDSGKDPSACETYCRDDPSDRKCLEKTGKAFGATWYEVGKRYTDPPRGPEMSTSISCRHKTLAQSSDNWLAIQCASGTSQCTHAKAMPRRFPTLQAAAADACEQAVRDIQPPKTRAQEEQEVLHHMSKACAAGERAACLVHCRKDPGSVDCLQKNGRASGTVWYEREGRDRSVRGDATTVTIPVACRQVPVDAPHNAGWVQVSCVGKDANCLHNRDPVREPKYYATLDAAASDACAKALRVHKPPKVEPRTAQELFDEGAKGCAAGNREACLVYCTKDPGSVDCLQKNGRTSGALWYEGPGRGPSLLGAGRTVVPVVCRQVPVDAPKRGGWVEASCAANDSTCTHNREPMVGPKYYATLDAAASDACRIAYDVYRKTPGS